MRHQFKEVKVLPLVVQVDFAFADEVDLSEFLAAVHQGLAWVENTSIHPDDELISESNLTSAEEVVKASDEVLKDGLHKFSLVPGRQHLVELILLDDQVEIKEECLPHILSNVEVQFRIEVVWLRGALNFLDPKVKLPHAPLNQGFEGGVIVQELSHYSSE